MAVSYILAHLSLCKSSGMHTCPSISWMVYVRLVPLLGLLCTSASDTYSTRSLCSLSKPSFFTPSLGLVSARLGLACCVYWKPWFVVCRQAEE